MKALFFCAVCATMMLVIGCGGGGNPPLPGQFGVASITIQWPEQALAATRFIPKAANSIKVVIDNGAGYTNTQIVPRPADGTDSVVTFTNVPVGELAVTITAYASADGTGVPLGTATTVVQVENRQTTSVNLDMNSTISQVTIDQFPTSFNVGETADLVATAHSAAGAVVPVLPQPQGFYWSSSDTAIATVDEYGEVTALKVGTVTITAMERETGVTGSISLQITPASGTLSITVANATIAVSVTPADVNVTAGATQPFTAKVTGVPNQAVLWRVQEGTSGGSISATGLYTAPAVAGTYHVVAVSIADERRSATATVHVQPGVPIQPNSLRTYQGHTYYLLDQSSWTAAEAAARSLGGHLVTIGTAAENQWVFDTYGHFNGQYRQLWIGLYQLPGSVEPGGGWVWADGAPVTYANWRANEPNNQSGVEHYTQMQSYYGWTTWNDAANDSPDFYGVVEVPN